MPAAAIRTTVSSARLVPFLPCLHWPPRWLASMMSRVRSSLLLAEQPGRAQQQHDHHDEEHHGRRCFRIEHFGQAFDHAKPEAGQDRAHDRTHAADHHHREHDDDQVLPHQGRDLDHRCGQHAGKRGQRHAEAVGQRHHQRHVDAEGLDHLGVLGAGAQVGAQLGLLDHVPGGEAHHQRRHHDPGAIVRQDHEAEVSRALQHVRRRVRQPRHAVGRAEDALDHQRDAQRQQQAVDVVELVDPAQHGLLDHHAQRGNDQRRQQQHEPVVQPGVLHAHPGQHRAEHEERAVREVDDVEQAEDHRQAQAQHRIEGAVDQPQQELGKHGRQRDSEDVHGHRFWLLADTKRSQRFWVRQSRRASLRKVFSLSPHGERVGVRGGLARIHIKRSLRCVPAWRPWQGQRCQPTRPQPLTLKPSPLPLSRSRERGTKLPTR
ncbi:hypothetical protein CBM2599_A10153 [Cupriavidus taiwanensis]|nr:hypothetical protein CBM2599_A10153 [Cupriavidus taiwanensis]SOY87929.1 hypothetical protein CBM2600_A170151 [Cupriavidus taiwanensis]